MFCIERRSRQHGAAAAGCMVQPTDPHSPSSCRLGHSRCSALICAMAACGDQLAVSVRVAAPPHAWLLLCKVWASDMAVLFCDISGKSELVPRPALHNALAFQPGWTAMHLSNAVSWSHWSSACRRGRCPSASSPSAGWRPGQPAGCVPQAGSVLACTAAPSLRACATNCSKCLHCARFSLLICRQGADLQPMPVARQAKASASAASMLWLATRKPLGFDCCSCQAIGQAL